MKGPIGEEELKTAKKGIELLGGNVEEIKNIKIGDSERKIIIIKKIKNTPKKYPRKPGIPSKSPIK